MAPIKKTSRSKREVKAPSFETSPEVQVQRSIRYQHRNTLFCFFYHKACVSTTLNSIAWPRGYSDEQKLAMKPGQYEFIRHNQATHRMLYLGYGLADEVRLHKKLTEERVKRGLPPTYLNCVIPDKSSKKKAATSVTQATETIVPESPDIFSSPEVHVQEGTAHASNKEAKAVSREKVTTQALLFQEKAVMSDKPNEQARSPAVCKEFMEFMKGHEERMRRAERVANEIKVGHDKKKRKLLGELDQTAKDVQEICLLQKHGFQSIDEHPELMVAYPVHRVDFEGEDLMKAHKANAHPSQLGRFLRRVLFGEDGLVEEMIDSTRSAKRSEAPRDKVVLFQDVVMQKYPLTPQLAYRKAKEAANQAGRERLSYSKRTEVDDDAEIAAVSTPTAQ